MPSLRAVFPMFIAMCCVACSTGTLFAQGAPAAAAVGRSAPFPPGNIRPTLLDFVTGQPISYRMQVASTPKLMRPPFADQPLDQPKGLAYKIKAEQVDVKNRVKAVRFLGQQDCMDPGTAVAGEPPKPGKTQKVLIATMQSDPSEVVRYEAVKALENQLSRGPCGKIKRTSRGRYENCLGCCNEEVLTALSARAYDTDPHGCPIEPSERVRQAAADALAVCGIDCNVGPIPDTMNQDNGIKTDEVPIPQQIQEEPGANPAPAPAAPEAPQAAPEATN